MNKAFLALSLVTLTFTSCSKSTTDEFEEANPGTSEKYIEEVKILGSSIEDYNRTISIGYDSDGRVSNIYTGSELALTVFENGELKTISSNSTDPFTFDELYQSPYDIYEDGRVVSYDTNGNPELIEFFETDYEYDYNTGSYIENDYVYTALISYDGNPNPYYHTLKAAGLIDVLDKVQVNLSMSANQSDIKKAKEFFPLNNIKEIIYKDETGSPVAYLKIDYVYDEDNYPTQATVSWTHLENEENEIIQLTYSYINQ